MFNPNPRCKASAKPGSNPCEAFESVLSLTAVLKLSVMGEYHEKKITKNKKLRLLENNFLRSGK
ncbi:hypothetical protein [Pararobbsia alpina]|uniref:hypothetical protein n=1 Tax=Pararobbsia alpina TaxID=621374 RepID=UPI0039A5F633